MSSIFFSDLHLKVKSNSSDFDIFREFIDKIRGKYDQIFIVGDLFAYWYEHPSIDLYSDNPALIILKELTKTGVEIFFLKGNRDFMAGTNFKKYSGIEHVEDEIIRDFNGKKVYISHGDNLAKQDIRYRIWKTFIRHPLSKYVFEHLPVGLAISVADRLKKIGKKNPIAEKMIADMIIKSAPAVLKEKSDILIAGHAHIKIHQKKNGKEVFILPEFSFPGEFLVEQNGEFRFEKIGM